MHEDAVSEGDREHGHARQAGGSPLFIAATGIDLARDDLTFEQALALSRLVLQHRGGPVPTKGKRAPLERKTIRKLTSLGLVEQIGVSEFTPVLDVHSAPALGMSKAQGKKYDVNVTTRGAHDTSRWLVHATAAGAALVREHLPDTTPRLGGDARVLSHQDPFDVFAVPTLFDKEILAEEDGTGAGEEHQHSDHAEPGSNLFESRWQAVKALEDPATWAEAGIEDGNELTEWFGCGFDALQARSWRTALLSVLPPDWSSDEDLGTLSHVARVWLVAGFAVEDIRQWCEALDSDDPLLAVGEAREWRAAGFSPPEAYWWRSTGQGLNGEGIEFAALFASAGWTFLEASLLRYLLSRLDLTSVDDTIRQYLALNLPATTILNYAKAGVVPDEVLAYEDSALSEFDWEMALRERGRQLSDFDSYYGMLINRLIFGEEERRLRVPREYYEEEVTRDAHAEVQGGTYPNERPFKDSYWHHRREVAEQRRSTERQRRFADRCEGSGQHGYIEDIPGFDDQRVICRYCGLTTVGGSSIMLPHTRSGGRPRWL